MRFREVEVNPQSNAGGLYAEIQLVFRDEPQPSMLASLVDAVLRMRDRMQRDELQNEPVRVPSVPRPSAKPWKR
jgi:hypothetical protein